MNQIIKAARPATILRGAKRPDLLRDETLPELFSATAAARADHVALICGDERVTYAAMAARAGAIAAGLSARGIGPGDVVGLWMRRGADLLTAQVGITMSGAAWLPFDAETPVERIVTCLGDAGGRFILTSADLLPRLDETGLEALVEATAARPGPAPDVRAAGLTPDHPAYLIYTSGSTGTPKGIVVSHRNICHYLRSGNALYGLGPDDVMFQSASVAFDLSMEEIWIPYLVGATLWVATPEVLADTDRLADVIAEAGITAVDMVPTLLSLFPRDVPSLRLILLGGEALPPSVVQRWARPGRRIFNTYGPTEATVVATACEVVAGETVTIGGPVPNYSCYVVREDMTLAAPGEQGELLIGGPGVAQGYLKRPELTAEKFIANPFGGEGGDPVLYRSGDAVSIDPAGNIVFHGRIDDQVKIRGFRVELGEIETRLDALPGIGQAAVVLRQDDGLDRLVAFVVPEPGAAQLDRGALRAALAEQMPPYMVPSRFEVMETLPRLVSGKIDRKALKAMTLAAPVDGAGEQEAPRSETEALLLAAAQTVFPGQALPFEADFFTDLGGHSLIAACFISAVRQTPALAGITLQDVYGARTLRAMAARLDARLAIEAPAAEDLAFTPPPVSRRFWCGVAQAAALPFILGLMTAQWLGVFVTYMLLVGEGWSFWSEVALLLGVYMGINVATVAIAIATKWILLGRTKPGRYPLWGAYYYRWWLVTRVLGLTHMKWFQGTPVMRAYLRALGARVGDDAIVCEIESGALDLVTIGEGASIGGKVALSTAEVIGNELVIGPVEIGARAYVGTSCVVCHGATIGRGAELADLTAVGPGVTVGAWEKWDGSPARRVGMVDRDQLAIPLPASQAKRRLQAAVYVLALLLLPPVSLLPIFPAFYVFDQIDAIIATVSDASYLTYLPLLAWPTAMALIAITVLLIAAVRWTVLPRVRAGTYSVHSWFYVRKWIVALATEVTLDTLSSLYATVYMRNWYRLMGAKIGKDAEISSNLAGRYDLTEIGEKCFIADEVVLGDEEIRDGWMTLHPVRTGARVFVGNDAVVPAGASIPDGSLIGIKSKPPANDVIQAGDTWFGSPPIQLPTRQKVDGIAANWTYAPSKLKRVGRAVFEAFNLSLPTMLFITFGTLAVELFLPSVENREWLTFAALFLAAGVAISVAMTLVVVGVKWALMGRYVPTMKPMWSWWALRTEAVAVMYWGLAGKVLLDHLRGTPMLAWVLRLFGVKVGKGCYLGMTDLTEFDCVEIGDFVAMNEMSSLQTHLYEDRVMKVGRVRVGRGVTIGAASTVLYDTHVGDFARLGPLTLVMKGESLPAGTAWVGAPAVPQAQADAAATAMPVPAASNVVPLSRHAA
ncbi:Pls/PosA family non-ribosomal peptide synthetase [Alsobacter sp. R-9]